MTRQEFLNRLKAGLAGLPPARIGEILADYASHFDEGHAAGRTEAEVATALGDPSRLAKELRAEAHVERWKEERTPAAGAAAVIALIGLIALDVIYLLPLVFLVFIMLAVMAAGAIAMFVSGPTLAIVGHLGDDWSLAQPSALLMGLCMMAGGVALGSLTALIAVGCFKLLSAWARLHMQVVTPSKPV